MEGLPLIPLPLTIIQFTPLPDLTIPSSPFLPPPSPNPPRKVSKDSLKIEIADQMAFILAHPEKFNFVLQLPGQQMEHCGLFDHAVITLVDPMVNPQLYCLSVGHSVYNGNAMKVFCHSLPLKPLPLTSFPLMKRLASSSKEGDGAEMSFQVGGELVPVVTASKLKKCKGNEQKSDLLLKGIGQWVSSTIKAVGAATKSTDVAVEKNAVIQYVKEKKRKDKDRAVKGVQTKAEKKEQMKKRAANFTGSSLSSPSLPSL